MTVIEISIVVFYLFIEVVAGMPGLYSEQFRFTAYFQISCTRTSEGVFCVLNIPEFQEKN